MEHTFIEVKTGTVIKLDDVKDKKEYEKKTQSEYYMEWFCFD